MKTYFFSPKDLVAINKLLVTVKLVCDTNQNQKEAPMWILPYFVHETLAVAPNSRMYAKSSLAPFLA